MELDPLPDDEAAKLPASCAWLQNAIVNMLWPVSWV
jgi:hypothetical protein